MGKTDLVYLNGKKTIQKLHRDNYKCTVEEVERYIDNDQQISVVFHFMKTQEVK